MSHLVMRRPHLRDLAPVPPMPAGYVLRPYAGEADLAGLAETLAAAFAEAWPEERVRRSLTEAADVDAVFVVAVEGRPVATASSNHRPGQFPGAGVVHWVGTHPAHRGRGLGSALVARVLQHFAALGDGHAALETDDERLPAIRSYLRHGFLPVYDPNGEDHRDRWSAVVRAAFGG